jgi:lysophospholipase L1-like esterase
LWITGTNADPDAVLEFLGDVHQIYRWQEYYSLINAQIAKAENTACLPIREYFLDKGPHREWMGSDGIHPNELGHRYIYEVFLAQWNQAAALLDPAV